MGEKTFGFCEGIIATHTSNIDGDSADERPVSGGIIVFKGSGIFAQNHILNPWAKRLNKCGKARSVCGGVAVRVKARRFRVAGRDILKLADEWLIEVPLVEYHPVFDHEDRLKLRDWAIVEAHLDLVQPWYKVEKGLIRVRSLCEIEESDWQQLVRFCARLRFQVRESLALTIKGIKVRPGFCKPS